MRQKNSRRKSAGLKALLAALQSDNSRRAERAASLLVARKDPACLKPMLRRMMNWSGYRDIYRCRAASVLGSFGENAELSRYLLAALQSQNPKIRVAAAWAMGEAPQFAAIARIKRLIASEKESEVRAYLLRILANILWRDRSWATEFFEFFARATKDADPSVRHVAYEALSRMRDPRSSKLLKRVARDKDAQLRFCSAQWRDNLRRAERID